MNTWRLAFRQWLKHPGVALVAVLTLALGIGSTTAILSVADAVLLRPLPYADSGRIVQLFETRGDGGLNSAAGGVFLDWHEHKPGLESVALLNPVTCNWRAPDRTEALSGLEATHEFLRVFGLEPKLGRGFDAASEQPGEEHRVVLLAEEAWRSRFGADQSIIGRVLVLDEIPRTVIGVLPAGSLMRGVVSPRASEFVIPVLTARQVNGRFSRSTHWATVYGRLTAGTTVTQAEAQLRALRRQLNPQYPGYKRDWGVAVQPMREQLAAGPRPALSVLVAAVLLVLLVVCANVASLLLARASDRQHEFAVRAALGAGTGHLIRQVMAESLVLAAAGGLGGILLAYAAVQAMPAWLAPLLPDGMHPQLDGRMLGCLLVTTTITGLLFGAVPAWLGRRPNLSAAIQSGSRTSTRRGGEWARAMMVVAEVGVTVVLLAGTGLLLRSLVNVIRADPGFDPARVLAVDLVLPAQTYPSDAQRFQFSQEVLARMRNLPGVEVAATGMGIPYSGGSYGEGVRRADAPASPDVPIARINYVSDGYLEALGARFLGGRSLRAEDDRPGAARVLVINDAVRRRFFPEENPVGQRLALLGQTWEIVGVVADVPDRQVDGPSNLFCYVPHVFNAARYSVVIRTRLAPLSLVPAVQTELRRLDPGVALSNARALDRLQTIAVTPRRLVLGLIAGFAGAALILAVIGLYGLLAMFVAQRRRELGIRLALGATRRDVIGLVVGRGLSLTAVGLVLGVAGAWMVGRLLSSQLYQVSAFDPWVMLGVIVLVGITAVLGAGWPAWRAARIDPTTALRTD